LFSHASQSGRRSTAFLSCPGVKKRVQGTGVDAIFPLQHGDFPNEGEGDQNESKGGIPMKRTPLLVCAVLLVASLAFAGPPNTYQVTGPVLELKDDVIVVQKGKDKWEIARGKDTKVTGDLKVGSKVTIEYRMTATAIEVKDAKAKETKKK